MPRLPDHTQWPESGKGSDLGPNDPVAPQPDAARTKAMTAPALAATCIVLAVVAVLVAGTLAARAHGYTVGGEQIVRCTSGHVFTTIWIPGMSLKSVRLGWVRLQRCPIGDHVALVTPVRDQDLTDEELRFAREHHDIRVP